MIRYYLLTNSTALKLSKQKQNCIDIYEVYKSLNFYIFLFAFYFHTNALDSEPICSYASYE